MKKYWIVFKNSLQTNLAYRANFFAAFIAEAVSLVAIIYIWLSIYRQGNVIGNYTLSNLIIYFLITRLIFLIINAQDLGREVGRFINLGQFANFINKPINFLSYNLASNLSAVFNRLISFAIFILLLFYWSLNNGIGIDKIFLFLITLLIGYLIYFLLYYIVGIITFFTGHFSGINYTMMGVLTFFSGRLVPIDIMPKSLYIISNFLPFKYIVYFPIQIITGKINDLQILIGIFKGITWLFLLIILASLIYKKGIKTFESYGG